MEEYLFSFEDIVPFNITTPELEKQNVNVDLRESRNVLGLGLDLAISEKYLLTQNLKPKRRLSDLSHFEKELLIKRIKEAERLNKNLSGKNFPNLKGKKIQNACFYHKNLHSKCFPNCPGRELEAPKRKKRERVPRNNCDLLDNSDLEMVFSLPNFPRVEMSSVENATSYPKNVQRISNSDQSRPEFMCPVQDFVNENIIKVTNDLSLFSNIIDLLERNNKSNINQALNDENTKMILYLEHLMRFNINSLADTNYVCQPVR